MSEIEYAATQTSPPRRLLLERFVSCQGASPEIRGHLVQVKNLYPPLVVYGATIEFDDAERIVKYGEVLNNKASQLNLAYHKEKA